MKYYFCTGLMLAVLSLMAASTFAAPEKPASTWQIGAPIVTFWAGPGADSPIDDRTAAQLTAGGWTMGWALKAADLDVYDRHGLRAMLVIHTPDIDDPTQAKALEDLVSQVHAHPALYAYYLVDEPGAGAFGRLGKLVAWLRQRDSAHLAFINLLPTYASDGQLNVSDDAAERAKVGYPQDFAGIQTDDKTALRYREYLRQFIDTVHPDLISYDHYHFLKDSDGPQYFLNLGLIRTAALEAGKPFMNIIQTCDSPSEGWRGPNENELRWLTYTSLAYGAQGLAHFRYDIGLWKDPKQYNEPLPLYWAVAQLNREFSAIATQLQPLRSLGAYHCGKIPLGAETLPPQSAFTPESATQDLVLGYFGPEAGQPTHGVVVNLDYHNEAAVTLHGPGAMEVFHAPTQKWRTAPEGKSLALRLPPGGGVLVRIKQ